jgi:uncharacterized protein YdeI (BOF family)
MRPILLAAALALISGTAMAQNTKGMDAQTKTSTTTNPGATVGPATPGDGRTHATASKSTDDRRMNATKEAQSAYEKEGKGGASMR